MYLLFEIIQQEDCMYEQVKEKQSWKCPLWLGKAALKNAWLEQLLPGRNTLTSQQG